ncbi:MAG TPA: hypothetical protein VIZ63_17880 [Povalibacter sp.]
MKEEEQLALHRRRIAELTTGEQSIGIGSMTKEAKRSGNRFRANFFS